MTESDKVLINKVLTHKKNFKKALISNSKNQKKNLDQKFRTEHEIEFSKRDCLECANCCKTTSPIFRIKDINRISSFLKIKESEFIQKYLKIDSDNDYVLKSSPCSFLDENNHCKIYEKRPLACKEYPHTNRKNMHQIIDLTIKNSSICPGVANIISKISNV